MLLSNIEKIHTTSMGEDRIKKNLNLMDIDPILYCIDIIKDNDSSIFKKGKNWYIKKDNIIITVNASSYTIITAHLINS